MSETSPWNRIGIKDMSLHIKTFDPEMDIRHTAAKITACSSLATMHRVSRRDMIRATMAMVTDVEGCFFGHVMSGSYVRLWVLFLKTSDSQHEWRSRSAQFSRNLKCGEHVKERSLAFVVNASVAAFGFVIQKACSQTGSRHLTYVQVFQEKAKWTSL